MTISADRRQTAVVADSGSLSPEVGATSAIPISGVHIGALDGLRGIAIILVLLFHYGRNARWFGMSHPLLNASEFGWCGVDLFFVLSGFLITGILYDSRNSANYFKNFYTRRALRIFPLYYSAFLFVLLIGAVWSEAARFTGTGSPLWIAFYLTNIEMVLEPGSAGILSHYWSLAIEEHFYLMWPLLVLCGSRRTLMVSAAALIVGAALLRTAFVVSGGEPGAAYILTPFRIDALATGAFVSLALRGSYNIAGTTRIAWAVMIVSGAAVLSILLWRDTFSADDPVMQTAGFTLIAFGFAGALVIGISWRPANAILNAGILRWFGRYSYGMYVWHPIVNTLLFFTSIRTALGVEGPVAGAVYILFAFGVMTLISVTSFHYFEKPFLDLKKKFS